MGIYVETGTTHNKAAWVADHCNGLVVLDPPNFSKVPKDKAVVCVANNGSFEAAGYAFDEQEFERFNSDDPRPRLWVVADKELVESVCH